MASGMSMHKESFGWFTVIDKKGFLSIDDEILNQMDTLIYNSILETIGQLYFGEEESSQRTDID